MENLEKFFVAGYRGMVGRTIVRQLQSILFWSGAPAANAATSPLSWLFVAALAVVFAQNTPMLIASLLALVFAYSALYARLSQFRRCFSAATMPPKTVINAI